MPSNPLFPLPYRPQLSISVVNDSDGACQAKLDRPACYGDGVVRIHIVLTDGAVRVRVADEGPGIPAEQREKVFEAFYRGRVEPERPGSGLGLAIVRAIVTAHGGTIWVEETTGGGTAVVFDLPIEEEEVQA